MLVVGLLAQACSSSTPTFNPGTDASVEGCGVGSQLCSGVCTVVARDAENCGACGTKCAAGQVCSQGACGLICSGGTTKCGDVCVDTKADAENCGACGKKCGTGEVCSKGTCAVSCASGLSQCGQACVDPQTDRTNCGGCGKVCAAGEICSNGACELSCQQGLIKCGAQVSDGGVSDAAADVAVSDGGSSDAGADGGKLGSPYCANPLTDNANCGGCGVVCGAGKVCSNGACATTCASPLTTCGSGNSAYCANTQTDNANCGGCGVTCSQAKTCVAGACVAQQPLCSDVAKAYCLAKGAGWGVSAWPNSFPNQPGGSIFCTKGVGAGADCDTCATYNQIVWKASAKDACSSASALVPGQIYGGHSPCVCTTNLLNCGSWFMQNCIPD
jgi:hypothetical protein